MCFSCLPHTHIPTYSYREHSAILSLTFLLQGSHSLPAHPDFNMGCAGFPPPTLDPVRKHFQTKCHYHNVKAKTAIGYEGRIRSVSYRWGWKLQKIQKRMHLIINMHTTGKTSLLQKCATSFIQDFKIPSLASWGTYVKDVASQIAFVDLQQRKKRLQPLFFSLW